MSSLGIIRVACYNFKLNNFLKPRFFLYSLAEQYIYVYMYIHILYIW